MGYLKARARAPTDYRLSIIPPDIPTGGPRTYLGASVRQGIRVATSRDDTPDHSDNAPRLLFSTAPLSQDSVPDLSANGLLACQARITPPFRMFQTGKTRKPRASNARLPDQLYTIFADLNLVLKKVVEGSGGRLLAHRNTRRGKCRKQVLVSHFKDIKIGLQQRPPCIRSTTRHHQF